MSALANRVRTGFYADSVALMRISRAVSKLAGVEEASLMIGTPSNLALLRDSRLLDDLGAKARSDDLVIAVRARERAQADSAMAEAEKLLAGGPVQGAGGPAAVRSLGAALSALPGANLALVSVPGEFAAAEARRALEAGLHVMMFSDNVTLEDEIALKRLAVRKGLLLMGPDCGTAILGGAPIAFANVVPRGDVGLIAASGTGLQEVSTLLARGGRGVSHAIGVGGRDLKEAVGGLMTLAAFDALDADAATRHIVVISKPPARAITERIVARAAQSAKPVTLCLLGADALALPGQVRQATTLTAAAEAVLGRSLQADGASAPGRRKGWLRGLFCGGTLCNEAQLVLLGAGLKVSSNVPVPGASESENLQVEAHSLIDLGDDDYTRGRPHPMIDPELRNELLAKALADAKTAAVLLDLVIGYGAHQDPAGLIAQVMALAPARRPPVIASVTGTDGDPQGYSRQAACLREAGVIVAASNAHAAALAAAVVGGER